MHASTYWDYFNRLFSAILELLRNAYLLALFAQALFALFTFALIPFFERFIRLMSLRLDFELLLNFPVVVQEVLMEVLFFDLYLV